MVSVKFNEKVSEWILEYYLSSCWEYFLKCLMKWKLHENRWRIHEEDFSLGGLFPGEKERTSYSQFLLKEERIIFTLSTLGNCEKNFFVNNENNG